MIRRVQVRESASNGRRSPYLRCVTVAAAVTLTATAAVASPSIGSERSADPVEAPSAASGSVHGVKRVQAPGKYFVDPYPIQTKNGWGKKLPTFSGTRKRLLERCHAGKAIKCDASHKITVTFSKRLKRKVSDWSECEQKMKAFHPIQSNGPNHQWHMALAVKFTDSCHTNDGVNVAFHARPRSANAPVNHVPRHWVITQRLVGHWNNANQKAGYNPRYHYDESSDRLFLIYIKAGNGHFRIVAQRMKQKNFTSEFKGSDTRTLLATGLDGKPIASEEYKSHHHQRPRLVETANVRRIEGRYVMVYSTGSYRTDNYKIGLAYSDSFLPKKGHTYRKVECKDCAGVWGTKTKSEVSYLLQSQKRRAAHYSNEVKGPGVGSMVRAGHSWYLFFAGYRPGEHKVDGLYPSSHRRPFSVPLKVAVRSKSEAGPLRGVSDRALRGWVIPKR